MSKKITLLFISVSIFVFCVFLYIFSQEGGAVTDRPINIPNTVSFNQDLYIGQENEIVYWLQVMLNQNIQTQIASMGAGSSGQETRYYGVKTADAVRRFAKIYLQKDVSGMVVDSTIRESLNALLATVRTTGTGTTSLKIWDNPYLPRVVKVYQITPYQIRPGDTITIIGQGFDPVNTVKIGNKIFTDIPALDAQTIVLDTTELPLGKHKVVVQNQKGSNTEDTITASVEVVTATSKIPRVLSFTPTTVDFNGEISITGENFSSSGNQIFSLIGTIEQLRSSALGTELRFSPSQFEALQKIKVQEGSAGILFPLTFYVGTSEGVAETAITVYVQL